MKRIIFTVYDDIKKEIAGLTRMESDVVFNMDKANTSLVDEYFDRLVQNKKDYAKKIGVDFKFFHNTMDKSELKNENDFTNVNLYKHYLFAQLAKEYDEVMYVDMDVVFNTDLNVFEEHDLSKGIHVKDQDNEIIWKDKNEIALVRIGKRSPTLKYFITKELLGGQDNHVMNTGIMLGRSEHILQINYLERLKEANDIIDELKDIPGLLNPHYYPNNESIFSYILEKFNIPYVLLEEEWHKIYSDKPEEGLTGHCIHFINKQFGRFFQDKTKCIYSLHIDIPEELLDNPKSFKDNPLSKSEMAKIGFNQYKDRLIDNHKSYAKSVGAEYIHFNRSKEYETFRKRFTKLSEYDVVNLYKIWLLDRLTKEYDLVMYVDLDVYFKDKASIFDTVPANHSLCCLYDTSEELSITNTNEYFKKYKKDFRNPEAKYWNAHAMLSEEDLEPSEYIFNTGIIVTSKKIMEQLDYFSDIDEVVDYMTSLKEDEFSMYPKKVRESFGYDNETIMAYKVKKNKVAVTQLSVWWHWRHYYRSKEAMIPGTFQFKDDLYRLNSKCKEWDVSIIHFISKNFGLVFDGI